MLQNNRSLSFSNLKTLNFFSAFAVILFVFLFIYLFIRAIFNEPIQDELFSYSCYIDSGLPHNNNTPLDANNHLLNTYLSGLIYFFSGKGSFFWMRLPNLLSFPVYFFSLYFLFKRLQTPFLRYTALIALTCIPFILEYFAYCRGYGLSFAFLALSLLQLVRFLEGGNPRAFLFGITAILLATSSNLSLIPLCLFIFGYFVLISLSRKPSGIKFVLLSRILPSVLFLVVLAFLVTYSFQLKKAGALYWVGFEGLWASTGVSEIQYIFFEKHILWKYIFIALLILFGLHLVWLVFRYRSRAFGRKDLAFIALLFGLLLFIECCVRVLEVGYPLDRGGLHIVIFFLLGFVFCLDYWKIGKVIHWSLLYFIWSFATHMSVHSSVFSPGDRITDKLYAEMKPYLGPETSILCNSHLIRSFYYQEQKNGNFHYAVPDMNQPVYSDIWINRTDIQPTAPTGYMLVASDRSAHTAVYKRKHSAKVVRKVAEAFKPVVYQRKDINTYELVPLTPIELQPGENVVFKLSGHFFSPSTASNLELIMTGLDEKGNTVYYSAASLRIWMQARKIDQDFSTKISFEKSDAKPIQFLAYLFSKTGEKLVIKDLRYKVLVVK